VKTPQKGEIKSEKTLWKLQKGGFTPQKGEVKSEKTRWKLHKKGGSLHKKVK